MGFLKPVKNFFKKYIALLPSIGITVVALLLFFPTLMIGNGVKKKMQDSVSKASRVRSLMGDVPSKDDPQQIKQYMDHLDEDATKIEAMMQQSSQRELISYDVFPPKSTSSQLYTDFGSQYRLAIENLVKGMNALDAPSESEIVSQTGGAAVRSARTNRRNTKSAELNPMVDALCLTRSQEISVYAHPSLFSWYEFWEDYEFQGEDQALIDCWDSQIAYWIYQDVVDSISAMNSGSEKVSTSAVKRLMGVSFSSLDFGSDTTNTRLDFRRDRSFQGSSANRDIPNYIGGEDESKSSSRFSPTSSTTSLISNFVDTPLTNRMGDDDVDVIHFAFSVLVDNRLVMAFMKELCSVKEHVFRTDFKANGQLVKGQHNQITILQSDLRAVDKQAPEHELYRYGKGAVMQLDLVCEYQFVRAGYDSIKPDPVKVQLGQPVEKKDADEDSAKTTQKKSTSSRSRRRSRD